jgi:ammonium transporter
MVTKEVEVKRLLSRLMAVPLCLLLLAPHAAAQAPEPKAPDAKAPETPPDENAPAAITNKDWKATNDNVATARSSGDIAWMLTSSALVLFMVPGLALFYGGMVRRKNVLATMMQSMVCLAVVGVYWIAIGYCLAFGQTQGGWIGWSPDKLLFLAGVKPDEGLAGLNIPIYAHVMFQGMFAIITPALISGAIAERIRFGPYCLFVILWVTLVYCPLAHWVWAMNWWGDITVDGELKAAGSAMVGYLGKQGALDFAGGTVVHIAAGLSGLAAILVLRKRLGYPEHAFHPNSMVLTLLGAGLLWFGWFGFNGGSAGGSSTLAVSAFAATQAAAAAAALSWMVAEWLHKGKPTALGWASGVVAGLVAVTPASGYIPMWGGLAIGLTAGVLCYVAVCWKAKLGYDDSLDAFGVHGIGGFLGAVLTGVFCYKYVNGAGADGWIATGTSDQFMIQLKAAAISAVFGFIVTLVLAKVIDDMFGLITDAKSETDGLDRTEHGEVGFDLGLALESVASVDHPPSEPRSAAVPPNGHKGFSVVVDGASTAELMDTWSKLCQSGNGPPSPEFKAVYPYMTLVEGNRFFFRGGDPNAISRNMQSLFQERMKSTNLQAHVE